MNKKSNKAIAVISGSRSDAGLLFGLMHKIDQEKKLDLQIYVTGSHLEQNYGFTLDEFTHQQLNITAKIELELATQQSRIEQPRIFATAIEKFSLCYQQFKPDIILVLGDRYEILAACISATIMNIPIAHLHGGEISLGAQDNQFRHMITKMAHLHFPVCEEYAKRIIQMGEPPETVYNVGATAIDNVLSIKPLSIEVLEKKLEIQLNVPIMIITWHPETMLDDSGIQGLFELQKAILKFPDFIKIITKANADLGGEIINQSWHNFVVQDKNCHLFDSLGSVNFLSLLSYAKMMLGNSSSALYEAAALRVASVNIGNRQQGRFMPNSIINCPVDSNMIEKAIEQALSGNHQNKCQQMLLPYGDGHAAEKIVNILNRVDFSMFNKAFYDIDMENLTNA